MAITINGDGTLTGISVGGLPDGIVDTDMLASGAITAAGLPAGSILQVQQTFKRDIASQAFTTTNTFEDISGLSVDITPVAADSNILVSFTVHLGISNGGTGHIRLARGSDDTIAIGDTGLSNQLRDTVMFRPASAPYSLDQGNISMTFLDDPTYTLGDTLTYKLRWTAGSTYTTTYYINRNGSNNNNDYDPRPTSSISAMEVAA